jgi:hypothetical protein
MCIKWGRRVKDGEPKPSTVREATSSDWRVCVAGLLDLRRSRFQSTDRLEGS